MKTETSRTKTLMRITQSCTLALLTMSVQAQTSAPTALRDLGYTVAPSLEKDGQWSISKGSCAITFEANVLGYKSMLDEWSKLKVMLDEKYGEPESVRNDIGECSYCDGLMDYSSMHTALQLGSTWIDVAHDYTSPQMRLCMRATNKGYFLLLVSNI